MISSRTRTGLFETLPKSSDPSPKVTKLSRPPNKSEHDSSPVAHRQGRQSLDGSPRMVDSRPRSVESKSSERRSPKINTSEKRVSKGSELQSQLGILQDDLKNTKELLEKAEDEKSQALADLEKAKRATEEANEELTEVLALQKRAEENCEIEKFRADELEQASIDKMQRIEQKWQSEISLVKKKHAADVSALLSANQEVERMKKELAMAIEAKSSALLRAENATKIAQENAKKVEVLGAELVQLRNALDEARASQLAFREEKASVDAWWESKAKEASILVENLTSEAESLKQELKKAKMAEAVLVESELMIERLSVELHDAKNSECNAIDLAEQLKKKVESLEVELDKAKSAEKASNESVASLLNKLEESNLCLQEAETEITSLRLRAECLEMSLCQKRGDLEKSNRQIETAKIETDSMASVIGSLKGELEIMEAEKQEALKSEELAALKIQSLMEEKSKLFDELQKATEAEEKGKNAMDDLAVVIREVSLETNEAKEDLATTQGQLAEARSQVDDLKLVLQKTEEKYQAVIDEAMKEIREVSLETNEAKEDLATTQGRLAEARSQVDDLKVVLQKTEEKYQAVIDEAMKEIDQYKIIVKQNELDFQRSTADWHEKELNFLSRVKSSEEEIVVRKGEVGKLTNSLKAAEAQTRMAREDGVQLQNFLSQAKSELSGAKQVAENAISESLRLKETLHSKENDIANFARENKKLLDSEAAALAKIEELSKLLAEKASQKNEEDGKLMTKTAVGLEIPMKAGLPGVAAYEKIEKHTLEVLMKAEIAAEAADEKIKENGLEAPIKAEFSVENANEKIQKHGLEVPRKAELSVETAYEKIEENVTEVPKMAETSDETPNEKIEAKFISSLSTGNVKKQQENVVSVTLVPSDMKAQPVHGSKNNTENSKDETEWENFKTYENDSSPKSTMHESVDEDFDSKSQFGSLNRRHGLASEIVEEGQKQHQKKKNALLHKFGGLLKKKHSCK
ncbi:putative WEB family protein [Nymphaea thermarum]|nr:putative WEB family protein [Nymphaea thermarum]